MGLRHKDWAATEPCVNYKQYIISCNQQIHYWNHKIPANKLYKNIFINLGLICLNCLSCRLSNAGRSVEWADLTTGRRQGERKTVVIDVIWVTDWTYKPCFTTGCTCVQISFTLYYTLYYSIKIAQETKVRLPEITRYTSSFSVF